jgi:hypothetical protein
MAFWTLPAALDGQGGQAGPSTWKCGKRLGSSMRSARSSDKGWCRTFGEIVVSRSRPPELMREKTVASTRPVRR